MPCSLRAMVSRALLIALTALMTMDVISAAVAIDKSNPSEKHVQNALEEAKQFLTYTGDKGTPPSMTNIAAVAAAAATKAPIIAEKHKTLATSGGKKNPEEKDEYGNKKKARAEAAPLLEAHPVSTDPIINLDLLAKYSQRAHYHHNASSSLQGLEDEKDFPKVHMCITAGEAYGAAWLVTKRHLVDGLTAQFNLTWVNCEMASFTVMGNFRRVMKPTGTGVIIQSLDVLDLSVLHLSTFERSHKRYQTLMWSDRRVRKTAWHNIDPVVSMSLRVEADVKRRMNYGGKQAPRSAFAERTIVVMPFLGGAMGAGHSVLSNRYHYLRACFWSIYEFFPHIVMAVTQASDVKWGKEQSNMPFYDVVLMDNLPKSASLPMGTVQYTRRMLLSKTWDFDYVYYTESDQILLMRNMENFHQYLETFPLRVLVPHRLMTYSEEVMERVHRRTRKTSDPSAKERVDVLRVEKHGKTAFLNLRASASASASVSSRETLNDWRDLSCCMPRQNCIERVTWVPIAKKETVPLLNYSGIIVPLGNSNYLLESYRSCTMMPKQLDGETSFCP
jgi:hypothetical protein